MSRLPARSVGRIRGFAATALSSTRERRTTLSANTTVRTRAYEHERVNTTVRTGVSE
ncbi:MAG: hypothetical protein RLY70_1253 [Planctomycetota bacterium]